MNAGTRQLTAPLNFSLETSSVCNTSQNAIYGGTQGIAEPDEKVKKRRGNVIIVGVQAGAAERMKFKVIEA